MTFCSISGTNLLLFSFPIMFIAALGCVYLHFHKSMKKSFPQRHFLWDGGSNNQNNSFININSNLENQSVDCSGNDGVKRSCLALWKRQVIVMNCVGMVSLLELIFAAMFVALLGWSLANYLHVSFGHLHMHKEGEKVWEAKFRSVWLRLGYIGNISWAFLFFPVTRGSSILPLIGLTSESSIKYHIWLGHISMVLFIAHSIGFIIYWAITNQMVLMLEWSRTYLSNIAGEIAFVLALFMWGTSIRRVRRKMFEVFFYCHQTYILYLFFYVIHVGVAYFCFILPGVLLFLIDRHLRFLQSRQNVRVVAARLLTSHVLELNFSKTSGLDYNPTSILFVNVPSVSKMQWHPFTVTSNTNMEDDTLSVVIKCNGIWSQKLYQQLSNSPIDHLQVSVEGPYGPHSPHFLRYEHLVLISGGSGITPFISIIRELIFQQEKQTHKIPSVVLVCAFKNSTDLSMLHLLLPLIPKTPSNLAQIDLKIQAYITRETEPQSPNIELFSNMVKPPQTIWFKPRPSDSPICAPLGPNSWLWLCAIICSSFFMFLVFLGIVTRYHIYPVEKNGVKVYNYTVKTLWDMFFVCASVFLATSCVFLWQKRENEKREGMTVQSLELGEVMEVESIPHQSVVEAAEVHYGGRPDLKNVIFLMMNASILLENNKKGSNVGVLACGPRKMRHEVAKICSSNLAQNLQFESISFNW